MPTVCTCLTAATTCCIYSRFVVLIVWPINHWCSSDNLTRSEGLAVDCIVCSVPGRMQATARVQKAGWCILCTKWLIASKADISKRIRKYIITHLMIGGRGLELVFCQWLHMGIDLFSKTIQREVINCLFSRVVSIKCIITDIYLDGRLTQYRYPNTVGYPNLLELSPATVRLST